MVLQYDVVIVGAGGAGCRAALEIPAGVRCAVITKLYPTRSHTAAAQGGVCAALGNEEEDSWEWHMFDTVKGGDYLGDQDAIEILTHDAPQTIYELEHIGMPFSRNKDGRIAQRRFGGHTRNFGEAAVQRACFAADRTGHIMLHTLHENCVKKGVEFFSEFFLLDVLIEDNICRGVVAMDIRTSEIHTFYAKAVMFATGGACRVFRITSNAHGLVGDGIAVAYNRGVPIEDHEFVQFHPTGLYKLGILVSEAARGEGGILRNKNGERFMERYAPTIKDLAPRDVVSRCIYTEFREGRGIIGDDGTQYVHLDLTHLGKEVIDKKLPDVTGFARTYLGVEPIKEPIPIQPTAHYIMGGIPTDLNGQVRANHKDKLVTGFYAAGECACVSVHGANRLGTNSLLDIIVYGRRAGKAMTEYIRENDFAPLPKDADKPVREKIEWISKSNGKESVAELRQKLQDEMMDKCSVYRDEKSLMAVRETVRELKARYQNIHIDDRTRTFNTDLLDAIELGYLLDNAEIIVEGALARQESRGAHYREDYSKRDDKNWLKHTFAYKTEKGVKLEYKPVKITKFQPKERKY
ncbi:MAG: succinate dehydrogenase flavoprotein subunit [candidate division KSB1 bacterium]|nr:succinate dehydrogenase flavoprotein subunit [candidate division KSB1 bacterium]MDZ7367521.1 succinate dehydrogenase flavoprotein subunit [candidate division KSB1 bacterium]MDZ7404921.1 succinate dehydrogenase flavoprotein subunit [candidate division KSB1 bacterium]